MPRDARQSHHRAHISIATAAQIAQGLWELLHAIHLLHTTPSLLYPTFSPVRKTGRVGSRIHIAKRPRSRREELVTREPVLPRWCEHIEPLFVGWLAFCGGGGHPVCAAWSEIYQR
jgi:hypothetical protein